MAWTVSERLVNLVAALLDRRPAPRPGAAPRRGSAATPTTTTPFGATSSGTRNCSARWACRWSSSRSTGVTPRGRGLPHPPRPLRAARPGSGRGRAGRPAPGRVGGRRRRGVGAAAPPPAPWEAGRGRRRPERRRPDRRPRRGDRRRRAGRRCPAGSGWRAVRRRGRPPAGPAPLPGRGAALSIRGGCRTAMASGTWPAGTTAAARPRTSGSTGSRPRRGSVSRAPSTARPAAAGAPPPPVAAGRRRGGRRRRCSSTPIQADWAVGAVGEAAVRRAASRRQRGARGRGDQSDAFRSFVLGFLDHAEVLGPAGAAPPSWSTGCERWPRAAPRCTGEPARRPRTAWAGCWPSCRGWRPTTARPSPRCAGASG